MNDTDDLAGWLRLTLTEGIGPQTARQLLSQFGLPENIFRAGFSGLQKFVPEKLALLLSTPPDERISTQIDTTLTWTTHPGNHVLTFADVLYPQMLLSISDPPPLLYVKGRVDLLSHAAIAIVGSRNATVQGIQNAGRFAQVLSHAGLTVVSGLARGIDAAAHEGALSSIGNHGSTIAVTGTGLDLVYPAIHRDLAHKLAVNGCLVSEYPLGTPAIASNFPRRNRIISGLSQGVLVVEAAAQSGSLITARSALEQGREVFAIPGSIHSPLAKGCHQLIRQGAKLVESAQDVLEELRWQSNTSFTEAPASRRAATEELSSQATAGLDRLLETAGHDPVSVDDLAQRSGLSAAEIQSGLFGLEMQGRIEMLAGGLYRRLN